VSGCRAVFELALRRCGLAGAVGLSERCPGARCPLWEATGGLAGSGGCSIEELIPHLRALPELAHYLLELRTSLREVEGPRLDS
jgi:hypothetical protein